VAFIIAATVVPAGDRNIAITRDCLELAFAFADLRLPTVRLDGLADGADDLGFVGNRFFVDFGIEILRSIVTALRRTTEAPRRQSSRRGRISGRPQSVQVTHSTARFAIDCQSFLG
jgi:hypothetical protein